MSHDHKPHTEPYTHHHDAHTDEWFQHSADEHPQQEHGALSPLVALLGIIVTMAVLFLTIGTLAWYFDHVAKREISAKQETDTGIDYVQTHARQTALLNNPAWVDAKAGIVRLPIDWAMDDTVRWYAGVQNAK